MLASNAALKILLASENPDSGRIRRLQADARYIITKPYAFNHLSAALQRLRVS